MSQQQHVIVIGAGIVGVSAALWLLRSGQKVTLIDRSEPGQGTSYGNAGVLAACSVVPVTTPGLIAKAPKLLLDPKFPLFMRWSYLPKLAPWLIRYLGHANDQDTRRIATGLTGITGDSVEQHQSLCDGGSATKYLEMSDYSFAYTDRNAFDADAYVWELRKEAGFEPMLLEGEEVREYEPALGRNTNLLAVMKDHGYVLDPGAYVGELAKMFVEAGGKLLVANVTDFQLSDGRVTAVSTDQGSIDCDKVVLSTGVWSKPLMAKLGLNVPLESERGYHIVFKQPVHGPRTPIMISTGKFVATPMEAGLRCAGVVEFGGLEAGPSRGPLSLLEEQVKSTFPNLEFDETEEWLGHRPAPADSLPLIGEVADTGIFPAFGHHHIGLTGGPKTGRIVAGLVTGDTPNLDLAPYNPNRFQ